ncbi:MAG: MFS transporter [Hyphomicrobiaceae bacterium]
MITFRFARDNARWLAAAIVLTWSSSFGQTYFISLSAGHIREAYSLTHGEWGGIYTIGTMVSAIVLVRIGWLADQLRVRALAAFVIAGFIAMCLAMSIAEHWLALVAVVAGLRLCGQGMMSHLALTALGRWFRAQRGRAIAIGSLGFALGEALLPMIFVVVSAWVGWRGSWVIAAATLAFFTFPVLMILLRKERTPQSLIASGESAGLDGKHWQRREAVRHWLMWVLLPGVMAPSFMITSLFFHQVHVTEIKGWNLASYVMVYPLYSAIVIGFNLIAGILVDRFGSARLLPVYMLPMAIGFSLYGLFSQFWVAVVGLSIIAISQGAGQALLGSIWPEYYGTRHLGAIRSLIIAFTVVGSAIGPGITGWLIDINVGFEAQCLYMALYLVVISSIFVVVARAAKAARGGDLDTRSA